MFGMGKEEQSTLCLRYGKALQRHWRTFAEPIPQLRDAVETLGQRIPTTDPQVSPRLLRDLFFTELDILKTLHCGFLPISPQLKTTMYPVYQ